MFQQSRNTSADIRVRDEYHGHHSLLLFYVPLKTPPETEVKGKKTTVSHPLG